MSRGFVLAVSVAIAAWSYALVAGAEPAADSPFWDAPATCAAPKLELPTALPASVHVTVRNERGRWTARVADDTASGEERLLVGGSCDEIRRAVVVTLSLLLPNELAAPSPVPAASSGELEPRVADFGAAVQAPRAQPSVVPISPSPQTAASQSESQSQGQTRPPKADRAVSPAAPGPNPEHTRAEPSVHGALLVGLAHEGRDLNAPSGAVAASVDVQDWSALARLKFALGQADADVRLELLWVGLGVGICRRLGSGVQVVGCLGPELELLRGTAPQIAHPTADQSVLPGAALNVALRVPVAARLGAMVLADAHARLRSAQFGVEPLGVVYTFPKLGFSLLAGSEVHF